MTPKPLASPAALLYADHHATTPILPEAVEAMLPWLSGLAANPSSVHGPGRKARRAVEEARDEVARALGASSAEIVFTSGGTEANALAVRGGAWAARSADGRRWAVVFTAGEHPAVREAVASLGREGFTPREVPVEATGAPSLAVLEGALSPDVALVSAILANNETGAVDLHVGAVARAAREKGILFHTDAVQAVGKLPVDVGALGVDLLSLTGHKFGGPKGAGALYVRKGVAIFALQPGGGQEKGRRGGTENVAASVGLGVAIREAARSLDEESRRVRSLRDRFEAGLSASVPGVRFVAAGGERLPTVSSAVLPGADGEILLAALDLEGIAASAGSACHAGTTTPSRVLLAMGWTPDEARSTLRFSFGRTTSEADIERLLEAVPRLARRVAHGHPRNGDA